MDSPHTVQFHPECEHCTAGHGAARSVTIDHRNRTITYVCDACQHTWTITDLVAPIPSFSFDDDPMTV